MIAADARMMPAAVMSMWCAPATIADGIEEFLEVKHLRMGGTDRSLTGLAPNLGRPRRQWSSTPLYRGI
jgi:hypothetical protein